MYTVQYEIVLQKKTYSEEDGAFNSNLPDVYIFLNVYENNILLSRVIYLH